MLSRASLLCRAGWHRRPSSALSARRGAAAALRGDDDDGDDGARPRGSVGGGRRRSSSSAAAAGASGPALGIPARCHVPAFAGARADAPAPPHRHRPHQRVQTRSLAGRKDRASTSFESRPPTRKQRKRYNRRMKEVEYEKTKHSKPNSKARLRRLEEKERTEQLIEIAQEEEALKLQLGRHFDKVDQLQKKIEASPKFRQMLEDGKLSPEEVRAAARDAAVRAAEASPDAAKPPLPSWWKDRMTYDWGDALVDDLMGNSADLTSSPSPFPTHMGGEYGRLRRKVERMVRGRERQRALGDGGGGGDVAADDGRKDGTISDKLLSDLIRSHRDAHGKRTVPVGLAASLEHLDELGISLSELDSWSYTSLLTCCRNPGEGRRMDEVRRERGVRSNAHYWSAMVDVYARAGDFRGAEEVLDEMLEVTQKEHELFGSNRVGGINGDAGRDEGFGPIPIPPLAAYTSFFAACYKLVSRPDAHSSIKNEAADRAWARWKEMRIHSVAPDIMAYTALMRTFAAQGRAERAVDLLEEVMDLVALPADGDMMIRPGKDGKGVEGGLNGMIQSLGGVDVDTNGWQHNRDGTLVRAKPTTLLFSSALRAVAKSHEIALRFGGARSRKNRQRESAAAHHGRMARKIVVLAEQAEVEQDDGFVAALMLCAAAAGDSSTARAIYLGSRVRRLDHLRTCGGREHLNRLQGLIPEEDRIQLPAGTEGDELLVPSFSEGSVGPSTSSPPSLSSNTNVPAVRSPEEEFALAHAAYEDREYGTDTRIMSALLLAHSRAMEPKGLGNMWAGKINRGYLCHNSLRYIEAYNIPQMENVAIPGLDPVKAGLSPEGDEPEDFSDEKNNKRLRKKHKFNIKQIMGDEEGNRRDDMDSFFDGFDKDFEEARRRELRLLNGEDKKEVEEEEEAVERDWLNNKLLDDHQRRMLGPSPLDGDEEKGITSTFIPAGGSSASFTDDVAGADGKDEEALYGNDFDSDSDSDDDSVGDGDDEEYDDTAFAVPQRNDREALVQAMAEVTGDRSLAEDIIPEKVNLSGNEDDDEDFDPDDEFFNEEEWERLMADTRKGMDDSRDNDDTDELSQIPGVVTGDYDAFRAHVAQGLKEEGSDRSVNEEETRQLFDMMRTAFEEGPGWFGEDEGKGESVEANASDINGVNDGDVMSKPAAGTQRTYAVSDSGSFPVGSSLESNDNMFASLPGNEMEGPASKGQPQRQPSPTDLDMSRKTIFADDYLEWAQSQQTGGEVASSAPSQASAPRGDVDILQERLGKAPSLPRPYRMSPLDRDKEEPHIAELKRNLPGLPDSRIRKVSDEFEASLGYPSILNLAIAVREDMPEGFGPQCLVRKNLANARHLMAEAENEGLVDAHLLNGMLRVYSNSGRIEPALRFYNTEYKKHGMTPTMHSDRLMLEMLVKKKRIARAFKLKQDVEAAGRNLDLLSYQTLVEHFGKHGQLGSALLLIEECIDVHGTPPGEKSLKDIRLFCRKRGLTDRVGLEGIVGKDPNEWYRRGQELKRIQSKKGRSSDVMYGLNRMLDI